MDTPASAPTPAPSAPASSAPSAPAAPAAAPSSAPTSGGSGAPATGTKQGIDSRVQPGSSSPAADKTASEAQKAAERIRLKLKIDGQEREEEFTPDDLAVRLQKAEAADKRFQESAQVRKAFQTFFEQLKQDPWAALQDPAIGIDLEALAEAKIAEKYRAQLMSDEERAQYEKEREFERLKSERDEYQRQIQAAKQAELDAKVFQETERLFGEALKSEGIEKSYETLYEMARIQKMNLEYGLQLTPQQLAAEVRNSLDGQRSKLESKVRGGLKGEALLKHLGEDVVKEVLAAKVAEYKAKRPDPVAQPSQPVKQKDPEPESEDALGRQSMQRKFVNPSQWRKKNILGL